MARSLRGYVQAADLLCDEAAVKDLCRILAIRLNSCSTTAPWPLYERSSAEGEDGETQSPQALQAQAVHVRLPCHTTASEPRATTSLACAIYFLF